MKVICDFCRKGVNILYLCAVRVWTMNGPDDENFDLCKECFEKELSMTVEEFFEKGK